MKNWIMCKPVDKGSLAMMNFILETSQKIKTYTVQRIYLGDRKGSNKPIENLMNEWIQDYLRLHRIAEDVPRYALRDGMREVLVNGIRVLPEEKIDWNGFSVEPRKGWRKKKEETPALSWEEYIGGKKKKEVREDDQRTVRPDLAVRSLFERGTVSFRWGRVALLGKYEQKLGVQGAKKGIGKEDFLRHVKQVDFYSLGKDRWKVHFVLE